MPFIAACPFCRRKVQAPNDSLGMPFTCKRCHTSFTLAPLDEAPAGEAPPPAPARAEEAEPAFAPAPAWEMPLPAADDGKGVDCGTLSFVCGGGALLVASLPYVSLLTIPLSGLGAALGGLGFLAADGHKRSAAVPALGGALGVLTLLVAGIWPLWANRDPAGSFVAAQARADAVKTFPFPCKKQFRLTPAGDEWVDASQCAAQDGELAVAVASAKVESVALQSGGKKLPRVREKHLVLRLQLVCLGTSQTYGFDGWGNAGQGSKHPARLTDPTNKELTPRTFGPGVTVVGHERPELYPKFYADDVLVFEAPGPHMQSLRLELPASAFGGKGTVRFQIPGAMIER